ncbi:type III-B CRISPR module RAMP protein Cmr4 [Geminisphaera colitermitum]|uniref:type III-B CRISPR module RAMP protein Cmr4 n=1 Tax=Geminisphaera colitermitum TaxID=1148786 RepID=UPI000158D176|nr:type III-B CRISPR module RAMP protein Cmr4 [Geminisphaera colitermitum]
MNSLILGLLAETSIHPGAGQSFGIVDLPVAREAATDYPVIPGSSVKGALLALAKESERLDEPTCHRVFGKADKDGNTGNAGALLVSDARLLLLPVRSLSSAYKWVTCPHLLERWQRDSKRADEKSTVAKPIPPVQVATEKYLGEKPASDAANLFLEERQFTHAGPLPPDLLKALAALFPSSARETAARLPDQLVILNDDDFAWFVRYGLPVQARNVLDKNKTSENLWYEESIPADSLFYLLLAERADALTAITQIFKDRPYLQLGGNETVGMGWFSVNTKNTKGGTA